MTGGIEASVSSTGYLLRCWARDPGSIRADRRVCSYADLIPHVPKAVPSADQRSLIRGDQRSGIMPVLRPLVPLLWPLMVHGPDNGYPTYDPPPRVAMFFSGAEPAASRPSARRTEGGRRSLNVGLIVVGCLQGTGIGRRIPGFRDSIPTHGVQQCLQPSPLCPRFCWDPRHCVLLPGHH